jgi:hypothetical protein
MARMVSGSCGSVAMTPVELMTAAVTSSISSAHQTNSRASSRQDVVWNQSGLLTPRNTDAHSGPAELLPQIERLRLGSGGRQRRAMRDRTSLSESP